MIKRFIDFSISFLGLLILSPLFLFVIIRIKMDSKGPVFYKANRVGLNKKLFKIYKFRSMVLDADKIGGPSTSEKDPRLTKIGKFIRKYKIDELPQLVNVFLGHMSLVGPRPEVSSEVKLYDPKWDLLFTVKPGITDLASIKFRDEGVIIANSGIKNPHLAYRKLIQPQKLELQKEYIENQSLLLDVKILFKTFVTIFK